MAHRVGAAGGGLPSTHAARLQAEEPTSLGLARRGPDILLTHDFKTSAALKVHALVLPQQRCRWNKTHSAGRGAGALVGKDCRIHLDRRWTKYWHGTAGPRGGYGSGILVLDLHQLPTVLLSAAYRLALLLHPTGCNGVGHPPLRIIRAA